MERFLIRGKVDGGRTPVKNGKDDKAVSPLKVDETDESDQELDNVSSDNQEKSDDEEEAEVRYIVERIDDKRVDDDGSTHYYIKWKGWEASSNTWEPLENLDNCEKMLADFEKRFAEQGKIPRKKAWRRRRKRKAIGAVVRRNDDDEFEEVKSNLKTYPVLDEWRANMEPVCVEGVMQVDGELTYVVKQITRTRGATSELDRSNAVLVKAANFRHVYPELVIAFYQSRLIWGAENDEESEEQRSVAVQMKTFSKLDNEDDEINFLGENLQKETTFKIKTEQHYAEFPEDLEDTDLSSGVTSGASLDGSEVDSESWKLFLDGDTDSIPGAHDAEEGNSGRSPINI